MGTIKQWMEERFGVNVGGQVYITAGKANIGDIVKLRIPADAKRVGGMVGRKCRAEFAIVLEGSGRSLHDHSFVYTPGETVRPRDPFNSDVLEECKSGIHFVITREEAEAYQL
jgi:hypothetical protein